VVAESSRKNNEPSAPNVTCSRLPSDGSTAHHVPTNGAGGAAAATPLTARPTAPTATMQMATARTRCVPRTAITIDAGSRLGVVMLISSVLSRLPPIDGCPPLNLRTMDRTSNHPLIRSRTSGGRKKVPTVSDEQRVPGGRACSRAGQQHDRRHEHRAEQHHNEPMHHPAPRKAVAQTDAAAATGSTPPPGQDSALATVFANPALSPAHSEQCFRGRPRPWYEPSGSPQQSQRSAWPVTDFLSLFLAVAWRGDALKNLAWRGPPYVFQDMKPGRLPVGMMGARVHRDPWAQAAEPVTSE